MFLIFVIGLSLTSFLRRVEVKYPALNVNAPYGYLPKHLFNVCQHERNSDYALTNPISMANDALALLNSRAVMRYLLFLKMRMSKVLARYSWQ